jgi:Ca2+-binding EF-hand superfamily protein
MFDKHDTNCDGKLNFEEYSALVNEKFSHPHQKEINHILHEMGKNHASSLTKEEFTIFMMKMMTEANCKCDQDCSPDAIFA